MMKRKPVLEWMHIAAALLLVTLSACKTAPPVTKPDPVCRTESRDGIEARTAFARLGEPRKDSKTVSQIENKITHNKGDQILLSKKLLQALLKEDRIALQETNRLSEQLEALKKVDLNDGSHPTD